MNSRAGALALASTNCTEFYHLVPQIVDPLDKLKDSFLVLCSDAVDDLIGKSVGDAGRTSNDCKDKYMFIEVPDLLNAEQLQRIQEIAAKANFVDGRISNPHSDVKKNLQIDYSDQHFQESSKIIADALMQNETVQNYGFVSRFAPPLMCRYRPGMSYGKHYDSAYLPMRPSPLRSDLSSTIFLVEPDSYEGGELQVSLGSETLRIKGAAGSAFLYPSTSIHEVLPVTLGERLVAITFIESRIKDENERYLLYSLNEVSALEGFNISQENRLLLQYVSANLERKWSS